MKKSKIIFLSFLSNSFEWYDYALFAQLAPIIGNKFFHWGNTNDSIIYSFIVFAIGYLARPIGGFVLGEIGDKLGRKLALSICTISMSVPTFIIGILPTYESIGQTASIILVLCRIVQGFSVGGMVANSISFSVEHARKNRGLLGSVPMSSICIGLFIGSLTILCLQNFLTEESFKEWGWRIPFLLGFVIFFIGLYIKLYAYETPEFEKLSQNNQIETFPLKKILSKYLSRILLSIGVNAVGSIIFYLNTVYFVSYIMVNNHNITHQTVNKFHLFTYFIMSFLTLLSGFISDKIGFLKLYMLNIFSILFLIIPIIYFIEYGTNLEFMFFQLILSIMSALYIGAEPALQASLFPVSIRNTSIAISYNIATTIFGGITPYFMSLIFLKYQNLQVASYYVMVIAFISFISILKTAKIKKF